MCSTAIMRELVYRLLCYIARLVVSHVFGCGRSHVRSRAIGGECVKGDGRRHPMPLFISLANAVYSVWNVVSEGLIWSISEIYSQCE